MKLLTLELLGILLVAAAPREATPPTRVYLDTRSSPGATRCLSALVTAFKADVGAVKGAELVNSRAKADVAIDVEECSASDVRTGGEIDLSAGGDARGSRTSGASVSAQAGVGATVGRVVLTAENGPLTNEAGSGRRPDARETCMIAG
jgi:hypothetical protein